MTDVVNAIVAAWANSILDGSMYKAIKYRPDSIPTVCEETFLPNTTICVFTIPTIDLMPPALAGAGLFSEGMIQQAVVLFNGTMFGGASTLRYNRELYCLEFEIRYAF